MNLLLALLLSSRRRGGIVPRGEWSDHEDRWAAEWLQKFLVSVEIVGQAVQTAARDHSFHPVRAYLEAVAWDGVERLSRWLSIYLGAEDSEYSRAVGARWLISAAARIFRPCAKADCWLIGHGSPVHFDSVLSGKERVQDALQSKKACG